MYRWLILFMVAVSTLAGGARKELTLDDIFQKRVFKTASLGKWKWLPGKEALVFNQFDSTTQVQSLYRYELETADTVLFVSGEYLTFQGQPLKIDDFWLSSDSKTLLLQTQVKQIWRRSQEGVYYLFQMERAEMIPLADHEPLRNVKFSPDGRRVAYVKSDNNLYVYDLLSRRERRLTRDGSATILNGHLGWLYEEEFGMYDGYRWSPDSRRIAFWREDQSQVKTFPLVDELSLYPTITEVYYPKVGETNPKVKIGVVQVQSGRTRWLAVDSGPDGYIPRLTWVDGYSASDPGPCLVITRLNRKQNLLELILASVRTGRTRTIFRDRDSAWVDVPYDFVSLPGGKLLFTSERSGYRHIYRLDPAQELLIPITQGSWEVERIVAVDTVQGKIYFTGNASNILERHLWVVNFDGTDLRRLTEQPGWHQPRFSPRRGYFIDFYSRSNRPPAILLKKSTGEMVRILKESDTLSFTEYGIVYPEFFQFTTNDGVTLNGMMLTPPELEPQRKYPVIIYGYGLPGSQLVVDRWGGSRFLFHNYLVQQGYCVVSIDNRQTGGRGKARKNLGYGDVGRWLIRDHIAAVRYLAQVAYVDTGRVGVWGWSGGGYFTALALTRGAPYFKTGVAVAPVTDWRLYDSAYTERYMGLLWENTAGYDSASVFTYLDRLRGHLLLIHGTADDNVHAQHTIQLVNAAIAQGKQIDLFLYPNRNHGLNGGNTTYHLFSRIADYFREHL
jgi:dipeptidyl-peptidase-4